MSGKFKEIGNSIGLPLHQDKVIINFKQLSEV